MDPTETDAWSGFKNFGEKLLNFGGAEKKIKEVSWAGNVYVALLGLNITCQVGMVDAMHGIMMRYVSMF